MSSIYICPSCESGVTPPTLFGGEYTCAVCGWKGLDPYVVSAANGPFASGEAATERFCKELLQSFAGAAALPIGKILVAWGLVSVNEAGKPSVKELARYLKAMARAMTSAVVGEHLVIEKERVAARDGTHIGQG